MNNFLGNKLLDELKNKNIYFKKNIDLSKISLIKASGIASLVIFPKNANEVKFILKVFNKLGIVFVPLGGMSNCIFRDGFIYTPLVSSRYLKEIVHNNLEISVGSGILISSLEKYLMKKQYSLYPGMTGIPATIGGAIFMNAGSYGDTISDRLISVDIINNNGDKKTLKIDDLEFGWRSSYFQKIKNIMIISAKFKLQKLSANSNKTYLESNFHRSKYQESSYPNLGSLFATKDIYKDIFNRTKKGRLIYLLLRLLRKTISFSGFDGNYLHTYLSRKFLLSILEIKASSDLISKKTANCIINKKKISSDKLIKFIKMYEKKAKLDLEIIIYSDIE